MSILQLEGAYENELAATGEFNPQAPKTALMLPSGQRVVLPTEVLLAAMGQVQGATAKVADSPDAIQARMEQARAELAAQPSNEAANHAAMASSGASQDQIIPLVEEQLQVGKRSVETGRVRVRRETEERVQTVSVPLTETHWEIEHIPVEQLVETQPEMRQVGETIIFPLVEERLVVKRELWLREEVHVRKVRSTVEKSADFPVRRDVLVEERSGEA